MIVMAKFPLTQSTVPLRSRGGANAGRPVIARLTLFCLSCSLILGGCGGPTPVRTEPADRTANLDNHRPTREEIEAAAALSVLSGKRKSYDSDYARIRDCAAALQFVGEQLRERRLASPEQLQMLAQASTQFQRGTQLLGQREGKARDEVDAEVREARQQFARQPAEAVGTAAACAREAPTGEGQA